MLMLCEKGLEVLKLANRNMAVKIVLKLTCDASLVKKLTQTFQCLV